MSVGLHAVLRCGSLPFNCCYVLQMALACYLHLTCLSVACLLRASYQSVTCPLPACYLLVMFCRPRSRRSWHSCSWRRRRRWSSGTLRCNSWMTSKPGSLQRGMPSMHNPQLHSVAILVPVGASLVPFWCCHAVPANLLFGLRFSLWLAVTLLISLAGFSSSLPVVSPVCCCVPITMIGQREGHVLCSHVLPL